MSEKIVCKWVWWLFWNFEDVDWTRKCHEMYSNFWMRQTLESCQKNKVLSFNLEPLSQSEKKVVISSRSWTCEWNFFHEIKLFTWKKI